MKKWTIITVAVLFALGLTAPGWAGGPDELEISENELVGANKGEKAENDGGTNVAVEDTLNNNKLGSDDVEAKQAAANDGSNAVAVDDSLNNNKLNLLSGNTETETEQAGVKGDGAAVNNGGGGGGG